MSRLGKLVIKIPDGVQVSETGRVLTVKGPKGELKQNLHPSVKLDIDQASINVSVSNPNDRKERGFWGLFRTLINNMVIGVSEGYEKSLEIKGVGYKVSVSGSKINLNLGFSHPIEFPLPEGISASAKDNILTISGFDKQLVGEVAASIRKLRKPEPYKGKGIKYSDEVIRRKTGKTSASE
jgi:large subunit ribosomal protein L6